MSACQSFRPLAPFIFLAKVSFFGSFFFFNTEGVWLYKCVYDIPLVSLILNILICGFSSILTSFFFVKVLFWLFNMERGVAI